jgi:hypothetical protein
MVLHITLYSVLLTRLWGLHRGIRLSSNLKSPPARRLEGQVSSDSTLLTHTLGQPPHVPIKYFSGLLILSGKMKTDLYVTTPTVLIKLVSQQPSLPSAPGALPSFKGPHQTLQPQALSTHCFLTLSHHPRSCLLSAPSSDECYFLGKAFSVYPSQQRPYDTLRLHVNLSQVLSQLKLFCIDLHSDCVDVTFSTELKTAEVERLITKK